MAGEVTRESRSEPSTADRQRWWWVRRLAYVWAAPNTLPALAIGLLLGGRFQRIDGVVEIYGPAIAVALRRMPVPARAMTVGHVVFGWDRFSLRVTRFHERVHVRQYERWGPFFIPAYLGIAAWLTWSGRDGYRDNPFESEAYAVDIPDFITARPYPDEVA